MTFSHACFNSLRNKSVIRATKAQLDLRQRSPRERPAFASAAQQAIDNRIQYRRVYVENQVAFEWFGLEQIEARGVLES